MATSGMASNEVCGVLQSNQQQHLHELYPIMELHEKSSVSEMALAAAKVVGISMLATAFVGTYFLWTFGEFL